MTHNIRYIASGQTSTISVPPRRIPCKMMDWRLGRFLCVWRSPDVGRVIVCNCPPLLNDRHPRYGRRTALQWAWLRLTPERQQLSVPCWVSSLATVWVDVSYLCVSGRHNTSNHYLGLRCGPTGPSAWHIWTRITFMALSWRGTFW